MCCNMNLCLINYFTLLYFIRFTGLFLHNETSNQHEQNSTWLCLNYNLKIFGESEIDSGENTVEFGWSGSQFGNYKTATCECKIDFNKQKKNNPPRELSVKFEKKLVCR